MKTEYIKIDIDNPKEEIITYAANLLSKGKLVAFPTETVYGLAARSDIEHALTRLETIKERGADKPFTTMISSPDAVKTVCPIIPNAAQKLMNAYWPGAITIVINDKNNETQGFRMPAHPLALKLVALANGKLSVPSANKKGTREPTNADHVKNDFDGKVDLVLDGGETISNTPSTVVYINNKNEITIFREGAISKEEIYITIDNPTT